MIKNLPKMQLTFISAFLTLPFPIMLNLLLNLLNVNEIKTSTEHVPPDPLIKCHGNNHVHENVSFVTYIPNSIHS